MSFLRRRFSIAVWEVILLLIVAIAFATVYRLYFSRAVALTQVCDRLAAIQNSEVADAFQLLTEEGSDWLKDINRLCQVRRPIRDTTPVQ